MSFENLKQLMMSAHFIHHSKFLSINCCSLGSKKKEKEEIIECLLYHSTKYASFVQQIGLPVPSHQPPIGQSQTMKTCCGMLYGFQTMLARAFGRPFL